MSDAAGAVRRAADTAAVADLGARLPAALGATLLVLALSGCAVVTVAGAAVSVGAAVVGTAVDVTVGAAKLTGKAIGSAVDAMTDDDVEQAPAEPQPAK